MGLQVKIKEDYQVYYLTYKKYSLHVYYYLVKKPWGGRMVGSSSYRKGLTCQVPEALAFRLKRKLFRCKNYLFFVNGNILEFLAYGGHLKNMEWMSEY